MNPTAIARLLTSRRMAVDALFPFHDLPTLVRSLSPSRIDVAFHRLDSPHSAIDLALTFDEPRAMESSMLFKETLIRSEVDMDFECVFFRDTVGQFESVDSTSIEVQPDVLALPSGKAIAVTISLLDVAVDLFREAHITDSEISYRVTLERANPDPESARDLVPALAELHGRRSIPGLEEAVKSGFDLLRSGGWAVRERICIPRARAGLDQQWIEALIRQYLKTSIGFLPDELWSFCRDESQPNENSATLHQKVARLRDSDFLDRLFRRIVPSDPARPVLSRPLDDAGRVRGDSVRGDYAFVSYAHASADFLREVLRELDIAGVRCWYDTSLTPGSRWDEELEKRIRNAGVLIACVSDNYQESKYCKRELKFADLIDKPILPIAPARWSWGPGLQMMFQELQVASFDSGRGFGPFRRTLESIAPQVFHS